MTLLIVLFTSFAKLAAKLSNQFKAEIIAGLWVLKAHIWQILLSSYILYCILYCIFCLPTFLPLRYVPFYWHRLASTPGYVSVDMDGNFVCAADLDKIVVWNSKNGKLIKIIPIVPHYNARDDPQEALDRYCWKGERK